MPIDDGGFSTTCLAQREAVRCYRDLFVAVSEDIDPDIETRSVSATARRPRQMAVLTAVTVLPLNLAIFGIE